MHRSAHKSPGLIPAAIFLAFGVLDILRADNVLEANGPDQNLTSIATILSTSTAQPALLAINGGSILSIDDLVVISLPNGATGIQSQGSGSRITTENINILALDPGQTGITGVTGLDGGSVTINGGSIRILGSSSIGLFANNGTVSASKLTILMAGVDSYGVQANGGGLATLNSGTNVTMEGPGGIGIMALNGGRVIADGITITTKGITSLDGFKADGVAASGGTISLENSSITTDGDGADGLHALTAGSEIFGTNVTITTKGVFGSGAEADNGGLIELNGATITANGLGTDALTASGPGSALRLFNSNVISTEGSGVLVENSASLLLSNSNLTALIHGIVTTGGTIGAPNSIVVSGGTVTTVIGDAFQVQNGSTNILVDNGATILANSALLRVPGALSVVKFNASQASLTGDIFADPASQTTVNLTDGTVLTGRVNPFIGLGADLRIDGSSQWVMTGSSNVKALSVSPGAQVVLGGPLLDLRTKLTLGSLSGTGAIFDMNVDLRHQIGDLIDVIGSSAGSHLLNFTDVGLGGSLRSNAALLVVQTSDGTGGFSGMLEGPVFKYYLVHGNGSAATPNPDDWYLVRADQITQDQVIRRAGEFAGSVDTPFGLSTTEALSNSANAAIGTYAAGTPLFYADMDALSERLGELRFLDAEGRIFTDANGKAVIPAAPSEEPPIGTWVRGFGNGMHIDDQVSRAFDQTTGGFQLGVDKRFAALSGDLYLGGFLSYFYASRDFLDGSTGSSNALSVGAYATWINPKGWYADLVLKYSQLWNYFSAPESNGGISTADYTIPSFGGSLEVGKRFDVGNFFIEPQAQLAGVWEAGNNYNVSNGLMVYGSDQYSLRGRLGLRAGTSFSFSNGVTLEPYVKVSAVHEFVTGDPITLDGSSFEPTLSGTWVQAGAGLAARLNQAVYLFAEYDYANGNKFREPWAINAGVRWQWGGPSAENTSIQPPAGKQSNGKQLEAKAVEAASTKSIQPWVVTVGAPGWLASAAGSSGFHGINSSFDVRVGQMLPRLNLIVPLAGELRNGRFGVLGDILYIDGQAGTSPPGLVSRLGLGLQQFVGEFFDSYRVIEGSRGWLDLLAGFRYTYLGEQLSLNPNVPAIDAASTQLVNGFAQQLATRSANLQGLVQQTILDKLTALRGNNPQLPVAPIDGRGPGVISGLLQQVLQSQSPELLAAIRTSVQSRVNQLKTQLASRISNTLTTQLNRSFSFYDGWFDPVIGLRGRFNLNKAFYLIGESDVGGFGVGSDIAVQEYAALGCQVTRYIRTEIGYRYYYDAFRDEGSGGFLYKLSLYGPQITTGISF